MPKRDRAILSLGDIRIEDNFCGYYHAELARRYGMSERQIRYIVARDRFRRDDLSCWPPRDRRDWQAERIALVSRRQRKTG